MKIVKMLISKSKYFFRKRIYNHKRKKALYILNEKYSGIFSQKAFNEKRKALITLGCKIGENVRIVGPVFFSAHLIIGDNVFIGRNTCFEGDGVVEIGDNVDIAPNVVFNTGGHLIGNKFRRAGEGMITKIKIGNGTWVGNRSLVFNNITIGSGCVIAAGTVLMKSIPDNVLVAGVPGIIKKKLSA